MRKLLVFFLAIPLFSDGQKIFLMGDAGEPKTQDPTFELLLSKIQDASEEDVLIFLGDNLYPKGLPDKEHPDRSKLEDKLAPQLEAMKLFKGRSYMIPGNHDWAQGRNYGWEQALNMQEYVAEYLERTDAFIPADGCPGPIEVEINTTAVLIVLNTQYFLHPWDKPDEDDFCENKSTAEALNELSLIIQKNKTKHIIIAAHHPVYTYGEHHGNFALKDHLLPLPLLAIHPLFRKTIGNIQDNTHPKYKAIMKAIKSAMNEAEHVIFVSGHEHSLQLINKDDHHFIVSGSGSKTTNLKKGRSEFGKSELGFSELNLQKTGEASIKFWGVKEGLLYDTALYKKDLEVSKSAEKFMSFKGSSITVVASEKYKAGKGKTKWMGANYRDVWATPIEVPVFDLGSEHGGLIAQKKGGGMQTKSLRLKAEDGKQYVLRSIEKYTENAMPAVLRKTFAQGIVQDQISSSHPFGAFIIPTLADAAQIYHTNPTLVFIPDDPRLGVFQSTFAGTLALYEERPNKEAASVSTFGGGKNVLGTLDVIEKLKDNDNIVDQNFVVRNRLFDMWIGDWDRHDDQWRWAEFDREEKGNIYRPIPRDRDQAFFLNQGIIPKIASRKWALPKIEGFDEKVRWAPGISQNARFFDRSFMNEPDWKDWEVQIEFLQDNLTDKVIEDAVSKWPAQIQELTSEKISGDLKARRADMRNYARQHYRYISREVEIIGSDKHEYFLIERMSEKETMVTMKKRKKDGKIEGVIYQRLFNSDETQEIRLYGLDGEDVFEVVGNYKSRTKIRIIGGTDKDLIINSEGENKLKNVWVYDRKKSTKFEGKENGISRLSDNPEINYYDRKGFKYDVLMPIATLQLTPDDGVFYGAGFIYTKNSWRKYPFASKHTLLANFSGSTDSYNFKYSATFTDAIGKWSFNPKIVWQEPFFVNNFFGIGNETVFLQDQFVEPEDDDPIDYYRVRMKRFEVNFDLTKKIGSQGQFYIGPGYRSIEMEETANRFISDINLPSEDFDRNNFAKLRAGVSVDSRDSKLLPQRGSTAKFQVERFIATKNFSESFTRINAEWAFYFSAKLPARLVIGNRVGATHNTGNFEFFNANTLGGASNLRGYRRTRFYGETSLYHNVDVRLKLFSFRSYIFPGQFGILAFHDTGRVWVDGEDSSKWHSGQGFGIWISPLNSAVLNLNYAFGEDENLLSANLGFFF